MAGPRTFVIACALLASSAPAYARADAGGRRALVEPTYPGQVLRARVFPAGTVNVPRDASYVGVRVRRTQPKDEGAVTEHYQHELSRLLDFDPTRTLLGKSDWAEIEHRAVRVEKQISSEAEHIEFTLDDPVERLAQTRRFVEKARGRLASILVKALKKKKVDPEVLAQVSEGLAKKYPFFDNPYQVELLISDMRGLAPALGRWDFAGKQPGAPKLGKLPRKIQTVMKDLGQRVFAHANVLFSHHAYADALVTIDAMRAGGLDPGNARFVTTPYPFDPGVRADMEARGVKTSHAAYSIADTKLALEQSIRELLLRSDENHGPILVLEDGGLASEVIAEKFANEMYRIRIVELTKAGERIAKSKLPGKLKIDWRQIKSMGGEFQNAIKERYIVADGADPLGRAAAERVWNERMTLMSRPRMGETWEHSTLDPEVYGFAHYTYSDSKYKREIMTPLYAQAVNRATFSLIEQGGKPLTNKRVTIIGGGAMGLNVALELRDKGFEITFVEPDPDQRKLLHEQHGFPSEQIKDVPELRSTLPGRGLIMELSGAHNILTAKHLFLIDDGTHVVHGSSKDNPFDMDTFRKLAVEVQDWKPSPTGQVSKSYVFEAAGRRRTLHFPGNGFTISHGGQEQNVPRARILPEVGTVLRLLAHAITEQPVSHFPFFGTPVDLGKPGVQKKLLRDVARN